MEFPVLLSHGKTILIAASSQVQAEEVARREGHTLEVDLDPLTKEIREELRRLFKERRTHECQAKQCPL